MMWLMTGKEAYDVTPGQQSRSRSGGGIQLLTDWSLTSPNIAAIDGLIDSEYEKDSDPVLIVFRAGNATARWR